MKTVELHWNPQAWMDLEYQVYDSPRGNWVWQYADLATALEEAERIGGVVYRVEVPDAR